MDNQTSSIYYNGNRSSPGLPNMAKPFLDCTAEVTSVRAVPKNRWAWLAADILEEHWRLELDDDVLDEMHGLAAFNGKRWGMKSLVAVCLQPKS